MTEKERGPGDDHAGDLETLTESTCDTEVTPMRWAEDADALLTEATRFLDASEGILAAALLEGDPDALVDAAGHAVRCSARARRFLAAMRLVADHVGSWAA